MLIDVSSPLGDGNATVDARLVGKDRVVYFAQSFKFLYLRMLKRTSQSTDITPLVNSAVEKLQELGIDHEIGGTSL